MKKVNLNKPVNVIFMIREEIFITTDNVNLEYIKDDGTQVIALIRVENESKILTLWSGQDYAEVGQYTDDDIDRRIIELLTN